MNELLRVRVDDASGAGEARRVTAAACRALGLSDTDISRTSMIVTEAATNLARHTAGGEILVRALERGRCRGIEILAVDRGPGMANPGQCLEDGVSTGATPGTGMGAIVRASAEFDIYSEPGRGTVLLSRYWPGEPPAGLPPRPLEIGAVCLPMHEADPCGDGWAADQSARRSILLLCDGLGHGPDAAQAARACEQLFHENSTRSPEEIVRAIHDGIRSTRGAAVAVAEVDHATPVVRFCGIGNIGARLVHADLERNLVSHAGIAGHGTARIQTFTYPWSDGDLLVLHSDGITSRWKLGDHAGLEQKHPAIVAGVLYRDFRRERDDCTVVVARRRLA